MEEEALNKKILEIKYHLVPLVKELNPNLAQTFQVEPIKYYFEFLSYDLNLTGFGFGDNSIHMSFGIGAFPFGFFTSTFNFGEPRPSPAAHGTQQYLEEQFLSKLFLWLAIIFVAWLMLA